MVARSVEGRLVGRIGPLGRLSRGEYGLMGQGKNIGDKRIFDSPVMGVNSVLLYNLHTVVFNGKGGHTCIVYFILYV